MIVVFVGLPIFLAVKFFEKSGLIMPLIAVAAILGAVFMVRRVKRARRSAHLLEKYADAERVDCIMSQTVWQGETTEQLIDSLGRPHDVDTKALKTKAREIWKYKHGAGIVMGCASPLNMALWRNGSRAIRQAAQSSPRKRPAPLGTGEQCDASTANKTAETRQGQCGPGRRRGQGQLDTVEAAPHGSSRLGQQHRAHLPLPAHQRGPARRQFRP